MCGCTTRLIDEDHQGQRIYRLMIGWTLFALVIALIAALFGYGGVVGAVGATVAQVVFWIFLVLFVAGLIAHLSRTRRASTA
jgi:uncharacterized membrane protein YtjA (UPF0391 family)